MERCCTCHARGFPSFLLLVLLLLLRSVGVNSFHCVLDFGFAVCTCRYDYGSLPNASANSQRVAVPASAVSSQVASAPPLLAPRMSTEGSQPGKRRAAASAGMTPWRGKATCTTGCALCTQYHAIEGNRVCYCYKCHTKDPAGSQPGQGRAAASAGMTPWRGKAKCTHGCALCTQYGAIDATSICYCYKCHTEDPAGAPSPYVGPCPTPVNIHVHVCVACLLPVEAPMRIGRVNRVDSS